jgi:NADH-quinone oxidoreductase subunit J
MNFFAIIFWVFALLTLGAAAVVVFSRNIVRSAFSLVFAFFGVAGLYVLLLADFLAVTQLMIYVGGILVLLIFGVMLTQNQINVDLKSGVLSFWPGMIITAGIGGLLLAVFWDTRWTISNAQPMQATANAIGEMLLTTYVLPFELASIVLLVALVGAAMIARREKKAAQQ